MDLITFQIYLRKDRSMRNSGDTVRECRCSPRSLVEVSLAEKQEFRYNQHLLMSLVFPNHDPPVFWESHHSAVLRSLASPAGSWTSFIRL